MAWDSVLRFFMCGRSGADIDCRSDNGTDIGPDAHRYRQHYKNRYRSKKKAPKHKNRIGLTPTTGKTAVPSASSSLWYSQVRVRSSSASRTVPLSSSSSSTSSSSLCHFQSSSHNRRLIERKSQRPSIPRSQNLLRSSSPSSLSSKSSLQSPSPIPLQSLAQQPIQKAISKKRSKRGNLGVAEVIPEFDGIKFTIQTLIDNQERILFSQREIVQNYVSLRVGYRDVITLLHQEYSRRILEAVAWRYLDEAVLFVFGEPNYSRFRSRVDSCHDIQAWVVGSVVSDDEDEDNDNIDDLKNDDSNGEKECSGIDGFISTENTDAIRVSDNDYQSNDYYHDNNHGDDDGDINNPNNKWVKNLDSCTSRWINFYGVYCNPFFDDMLDILRENRYGPCSSIDLSFDEICARVQSVYSEKDQFGLKERTMQFIGAFDRLRRRNRKDRLIEWGREWSRGELESGIAFDFGT